MIGIVYTIVAPLGIVGRAVLITQVAKGCIGAQPRLIVLVETLERSRSQSALALLSKNTVQILPLSGDYGIIIYLWQFVEFTLLLAELFHGLLVVENAHLFESDISRIECKT